MKRRLLVFGLIGIPAVALFIVGVTLAMALALEGDVDALSKRARAAARAERDLRTDVEAIRSDLAALSKESAAADPAEPVAVAAAAAAPKQNPFVLTHAPYAIDSPRPAKLAAVMAPKAALPEECIFRPGDTEHLVDCIRGQQNRGASRSQPIYR